MNAEKSLQIGLISMGLMVFPLKSHAIFNFIGAAFLGILVIPPDQHSNAPSGTTDAHDIAAENPATPDESGKDDKPIFPNVDAIDYAHYVSEAKPFLDISNTAADKFAKEMSGELPLPPTVGVPHGVTFNIGDYGPSAGVVFFLSKDRTHGMEYSLYQMNTHFTEGEDAMFSAYDKGVGHQNFFWGCSGDVLRGANATRLGTGQLNTTAIVNSCKEFDEVSKHKRRLTAAEKADAYIQNDFHDWFLPSAGELYLLMEVMSDFIEKNPTYFKDQIFIDEYKIDTEYWSSTQYVPSSGYINALSAIAGDPVDEGVVSLSNSYKKLHKPAFAVRRF
ncbi:hypothetical protein bplSymb_SCF16201P001 [Bathymodiolus platifrons methanotrophic gill symbiont]|uniref:hypothetical protein n=1 Tax=Bathymodiolus platifrons methanotrophic gill symbiont TaxID=113268 RepID=UPI000B40EA32|nr:hypothetical protein [Bathymodiolus platifrons methanotrophic gill symbiont]GAW87766.1 hypothetical protein bplSymb_SCF16201P001 [Bathymodiolus platifrons methanotrophic gill symbiont]